MRLEEKRISWNRLAWSQVRRELLVVVLAAHAGAWAQTPTTRPDPTPAEAGETDKPQKDLTKASIEDLMNIEVTSVSKKEQKLSRAAAAVYIISHEDIRRSGLTSVSEVLRMVPGLDVAQINANNWAISARGFNARFADTMLVLIDSRSLYSPNFAGVFWQVEQLMLEDIERIEVIRGPGAAVWGANAVSAVINIVTKKAADTQGGVVSGGGGIQERDFANARYGGSSGEKLTYRVYGGYMDRSAFETAAGQGAGDGWHGARGGGRLDLHHSPQDTFTVEGDVYSESTRGQPHIATFSPPFATTPFTTSTYSGGDVLGTWRHGFSEKSETSLTFYYDGLFRDDILVSTFQNIADIAFQHRLAAGGRHEFVWGAEYRFTSSPTTSSTVVSFTPSDLRTNLGSFFIQDEIAIIPGRLWFTPGVEIEHSPFTGFNVEPSGRLSLAVSENQSVWLSAAQATRTPQRSERTLHDIVAVFPGPGGALTSIDLFGSPAAGDESYLDFEAGYRAQVTKTISIDAATFYERYRDLQTQEPGAPFASNNPVPHTVEPLFFANEMHGDGFGGELALVWRPINRWKLNTSYSLLRQTLHLNPGSQDPVATLVQGDSPRHQFQLRSQLDLPHRTEWDTDIYYVGNLLNQSIPAYPRVDTRLGWHVGKSLTLDAIGQNLLQPRHLEFLSDTGLVPTYSPRRAFVRLTWNFRP